MNKVECDVMDYLVRPMVKYFNEHGLPTCMSCQGHDNVNMAMFWIEFHHSITEDDIIKFQNAHLNAQGNFCSAGTFGNTLYMCDHMVCRQWRYMAANVRVAKQDLIMWLHLDDKAGW